MLADALAAAGNGVAAHEEVIAARAEYARYGATRRETALGKQLGTSAVRRTEPSQAGPSGHTGTFRCDGPTWTVTLSQQSAVVKNLKGFRYLSRMITEPGREFHVLDLMAVEAGTLRAAGSEAHGIPLLDDAARDAYRRRLADIDEDIDEATRFNDSGRLAKAEDDRRYLINELARGLGIGGSHRHATGSSERARTAVARSLRYALDELAAHHQPAAAHFQASLRTGTYCSYAPDPLATVEWTV